MSTGEKMILPSSPKRTSQLFAMPDLPLERLDIKY